MSGLETATAVIDLIKFTKNCIDFYHEARLHTPQQHNELRFRLEVQAITFERWCANLGIKKMIEFASENPDTWKESAELNVLMSILREKLRFDNEQRTKLVLNNLLGLEKKFEKARNRLQPVSVDADNISKVKSPPLWKRLTKKKGMMDCPEGVRQGQIGFFGTGRWLLWDKKYFDQFLDEITVTNEGLLKLLDSAGETQVRRQTNLQVLNTKGDSVLPTVQQISMDQPRTSVVGTLASLKQINMRENTVDDNEALKNASDPLRPIRERRVPQYQIDDFAQDTMRLGPTRVHGTLDGSPILIEWKFFSESHPLRFEQIIRLGSLVNLLNHQEIYKDFHIPRCRGLVKDEKNFRVGLIFDIPRAENATSKQWHDLQSLISRSRAGQLPSLSSRIKVARQLATALHHFQSVSWLHKSLRSDNVVYFQDSCAEQTPTINGNNSSSDPARNSNLPEFYLFGLDLSRPDHSTELSETLSMSNAERRANNENVELFSHPESQTMKEQGSKQRYETKFDIYSFGLILLEIGLWRTLRDMSRSANKRGIDYRTQFHTKYCDQLRSTMGDIYWRVTQRCLLTDFDLSDVPKWSDPSIAIQLAFEKQVLSELERCQV